MISLTRRAYLPVLAVAVAGLLTACGGGSSSTSASSSQTPPAASATTATTGAPAGGDAQKFCDVVKQQRTTLQGTELPALMAGGSADAWKAYLDRTATMNQQLVDAAPADIQGDVKTLQTATLDLKSAMEAANYDVSKIGSAKLLQLIGTQQRKDATTHLVSYVKTQCSIDLTQLSG
jgi:hypothetical protein